MKGLIIMLINESGKVVEKTYDKVQDSYADILEQNEDVIEIQCNVPFEDTSIDEFTCDYVITKQDGTFQTIPLCIFIYNNYSIRICFAFSSMRSNFI